MNTQEINRDSLERIYPSEIDISNKFQKNLLDLHIERYQFAAQRIRGNRVLDIACGVGYGTAILYETHKENAKFVAVDIDSEAIAYAKKHYARPTIEFCLADAMSFNYPNQFNSIVSIETIEHLPDPTAFVERLVTLLAPDGVIIASVPSTPSLDANPYHLHDFTEKSFHRLFENHGFISGPTLRQLQAFSPFILYSKNYNPRIDDIRGNLIKYYIKKPQALFKRILSTLQFGFTNRYITTAWFHRH